MFSPIVAMGLLGFVAVNNRDQLRAIAVKVETIHEKCWREPGSLTHLPEEHLMSGLEAIALQPVDQAQTSKGL
ncbi:MAG: hypothetical protein WCD18_27580 [Thermosynechococcaceae cyanobacterium]